VLPSVLQSCRTARPLGDRRLRGLAVALVAASTLLAAGCKKTGETPPGEPEGDPQTSGAYVPPPLEMQIAEESDAAPAELNQAATDPDEETPAECFARCNRLRSELRKKERSERKQLQEARMAELEAAMEEQEKAAEARMAELEAAMEEQEEKGGPAPADSESAAAGDESADVDEEEPALDAETEARFAVSVRECRNACEDKCVRQCVERGKRRDLFDPAELEAACRDGCVVQK